MGTVQDKINREFKDLCIQLDVPPGRLSEEFQRINEQLAERRCLAKGKVLPIFVKPYFLLSSEIVRFQKAVETVLNCQEKVINLYFHDDRFRHLFELTENEIPLVSIPHGLQRHIHFSRLDAIMTPTSFKFLEFNCDSPGGAYYADIQTEILGNFSVIRELAKQYTFIFREYRATVLEALLKAWSQFGGHGKPNIAVMGNPDVANVEEFRLFAEYFTEKGYQSFFTDPWSLEYDGTVLSSEGRQIDLIYRRGILADYSFDPDRCKPAVQAYQDGKVCFANPFSAKLGDNKNLLAVLTDERTSFLFSSEELAVLREHLPWTRILREGKTSHRDVEVDLIPYITKNKDNFVVKPNSEYGGKGVVIGCDATQNEWDEAISERTTKAKVVQEYVPIPTEEFPILQDQLQFAAKKINVNFFTFSGQYGGGFCRVSDSSVINISAGGALVVFFVIAD